VIPRGEWFLWILLPDTNESLKRVWVQVSSKLLRVFIRFIAMRILFCASEVESVVRMPSQIDEYFEFYQDLPGESKEDFLQEQLKRWSKLKHAAAVVLVVIITLAFIKCLQCCMRKRNKKSKFLWSFGWKLFYCSFSFANAPFEGVNWNCWVKRQSDTICSSWEGISATELLWSDELWEGK
jgi:hypothetical protein